MPKRCIVLFSGGLDSMLALRLMTVQGIGVTALNSVNCFHGSQRIEEKKAHLRATALALGADDIIFPNTTEDVVALTKNPRHGYGKHLNACIDCRLRTMRAGFDAMREIGADFVVTGEVTGQRPMSQRKDAITLANREVAAWGHAGLLLRPLCAKLLEETIPAKEGWIDSRYLYDISGRGRDRQMALAQEFGIGEYPCPAGGCLLTDPGFSRRLAVLFECNPDFTGDDAELLKVGRHFQISRRTKIVVSRNEEENYRLRDLSRPDDRFYITADRPGAIAMARGEDSPEVEALASGMAVYYSKLREEGVAPVERWRIVDGVDTGMEVLDGCARVDPDVLRGAEAAHIPADCLKQLRMRKRVK
ncbi:MAG: hypothetical protein LUC93_07585 [Planctomycetaceae bacterium]|nr:hypothetical protein [Planctomycetaceae bacterium]